MTTFGDLMKQAEASGATFEILEGGNYIAKIIESEYKDSSNGKPQIKTRWEVTIGPKAGFKGLWNYFTLTVDNPNAMAIFYRQMTALGITAEFLQTLANVDPTTAMRQIAQSLLNRQANIKVKVDTEWNNNKIERINPLPAEFSATQSVGAGDPFAGVAASVAPVAAPQMVQPVMVPATQPQAAPAPLPAPTPVAAPITEQLPPPPF